MLALIAVLVLALIRLVRHGPSSDEYLLLTGSILSALALFAYNMLIIVVGGKRHRSILAAAVALAGFIPYLFGCYLLFYKGLWALTALARGFSVRLILEAALFVITGYVIVYGMYLLTEFGRGVDEGKILLP